MRYSVICLFILGGCNPAQLQLGSSLITQITTDLGVACASANVLASQAAQAGLPNTLGASVAKPCSKVGTTAAQAQALLDAVNTSAAQLLSSAGAAGINLKGL